MEGSSVFHPFEQNSRLEGSLADATEGKTSWNGLSSIWKVPVVSTGSQPDAASGISAKLRELQNLMEHTLMQNQTQAFASAHLILRLSPFEHHRTPSSALANPALKEELVRLYKLQQEPTEKGKPAYLRCQATGEVLLSEAVIAGHLFPSKSAVSTIVPPVFS